MKTQEKLDERDNLTARKKKDDRARFRLNMAMVLLLTLVLILAAMNWDKLISPFKDAALDVGKGGFPVNLPGSTGYVLDDFGENFCLLTDTYLYTYMPDGANIANVQHGFQNPVLSTNSKRIMVYDRNGRGVKCYSKTGEIFSVSTEDPIVFGEMGNDERCAVVTTSSRYANCLCVYNSEATMIFRYSSPNRKIMQIDFSDNDKSIYMTLLGEKGGELILSVARIDIDTETTDLTWSAEIGNDVTYAIDCLSDGVYVVTSGGNALIDEDTGEVIAEGSFSKEISGIPESDGLYSVVFRDTGSNGNAVVVYNKSLEAVNSIAPENLTAFDVNNGKLYLLADSTLYVYDSSLTLIKEYPLDDVYSDVRVIGDGAYLLGYNSVQRQAL